MVTEWAGKVIFNESRRKRQGRQERSWVQGPIQGNSPVPWAQGLLSHSLPGLAMQEETKHTAHDKTELSKLDQPCQRKEGLSPILTLSSTYIKCFGYLDKQAQNSESFLVCCILKFSSFYLCTQKVTDCLKACHISLFIFCRQSLHCFTVTG